MDTEQCQNRHLGGVVRPWRGVCERQRRRSVTLRSAIRGTGKYV